MEVFLDFVATPEAVAFAWVCTVVSCFYAFFQKSQVSEIKQKFETLQVSYSKLEVQNTTLEQKITEIENTDIHDNYQEVHQTGKTNINQGVIKGDFNFNQ